MRVIPFFLYLAISSVSCGEVERTLQPTSRISALPSLEDLSMYDSKREELEQRLMSSFLTENGYVVSYNKETGKAAKEGDSLLFTGLAMGVARCDRSKALFEAVKETFDKGDGEFIRIDPLPQSYIDENDPTSRDMEIGILFGLVFYYERCGDDRVIDMLKKHFLFLSSLLFPTFSLL